jgi:DNA-directed RNA polymerase subunit M/transcription elongation factor TFIIS
MNRFIIDYENPDAGIGHSLGYINSAIKIATQHNLHFAFSPLQIKKSSSSDLQWRYKQFIRKITFRKIYETHDIGNDLNYLFAFDLLYSNRSSIEDKIKNGELTPQNLAFMSHQEMNPKTWKSLIDNKIKRDANKYSNNLQASTDMFTCKKCKSKRTTYYELQTRSADEPATIFVTCLDCGKMSKH